MSTADAEGVRCVASLVWIALTEDEIAKIAAGLGVISNAVVKVSEVATSDVPATPHLIPLTDVWREDIVGPALDHDETLAQAPYPKAGMLGAPQILGEG